MKKSKFYRPLWFSAIVIGLTLVIAFQNCGGPLPGGKFGSSSGSSNCPWCQGGAGGYSEDPFSAECRRIHDLAESSPNGMNLSGGNLVYVFTPFGNYFSKQPYDQQIYQGYRRGRVDGNKYDYEEVVNGDLVEQQILEAEGEGVLEHEMQKKGTLVWNRIFHYAKNCYTVSYTEEYRVNSVLTESNTYTISYNGDPGKGKFDSQEIKNATNGTYSYTHKSNYDSKTAAGYYYERMVSASYQYPQVTERTYTSTDANCWSTSQKKYQDGGPGGIQSSTSSACNSSNSH